MKLPTLAFWRMKNKNVNLTLGVSDAIDITEILFALLAKLFSHLMQKY